MPVSPTHNIHCTQNNSKLTPGPLDYKLFEALKAADNSLLEDLLNQGANANAIFQLDASSIQFLVDAHFSQEKRKPPQLLLAFTTILFREIFEETGISPLFFAAHTFNLEAMKLLIENSANIHFKACADGQEVSPLGIESGDVGKYIDIMELLHESGLPIEDMIDSDYISPLEMLEEATNLGNDEMVTFLEKHGYHL